MHNHSSYSNAKVGLDSINRIEEMIQYASDIGLSGLVLSDHEILSGHISFIQTYQKLKEKGKLKKDFKIGLGNEIYYCKEENLEELKENQKNKMHLSQFYHFLLVALNEDGHKQLRELSSIAWANSWRDGLVERTPTFRKDLKRIVKKGDIVATSSCLGGFVPQYLLEIRNNPKRKAELQEEIDKFIQDCISIFGADFFFLELQPSNNEEQIYVNKELIKLSKRFNIGYTIATDAHYLKKEDRKSHKYYLLAQNIAREVDAFYDSTFIMSEEEVREYMTYLTEDEIDEGFKNTMKVYDLVDFYDLRQKTIVPTPPIPSFTFEHKLKEGYKKYPYIEKYANSRYEVDRYFLHLIQEGLIEKIVKKRQADQSTFHKYLDRINTELKELWLISEKLGERISGYYVLTKDVIDLAWTEGDSIVGVSRGCFLPDSKVLMDNGMVKSIQDVNIGENVISHTGKPRKVKDKMKYPVKEEMVRVKTGGNDPIECTKDHEILGIRVNPCTAPGSKTVYCTATCPRVKRCTHKEINNLEWIEAEDLKRGDYVVYPKPKLEEKQIPIIDVLENLETTSRISVKGKQYGHIIGTNTINSKRVNRYIDFNDQELAWFAGAYIGNGWSRSDGSRIGIAFHSEEKEKIQRAYTALKKLTGKEPSVRHHSNRNATQLEVASAGYNQIFSKLFGTKAKEKRIPEFFINAHREIKKKLLQGLFDTDGHFSSLENKVSYSTTSESLASQIKMLMADFGLFSSVKRYVRKEEKWEDEITLSYSGKQLFKMKEDVLPQTVIQEKSFYRNEFTQDDDYFYFRVGGTEKFNYEGFVYDLSVEEDTSYVVNQTTVHNSASGYLILFLVDIIAVNPIDYDLPHFRHLTAERPELPDVDFDTQQSRRDQILQAMRNRYGERSVLNIATFSTEGARSALITASRGMQIDASETNYLTSLIPSERGFLWSLKDCFEGNEEKGRKPVKQLLEAVEKYEGLKETAMSIEGLIKARSVHASGIYVFSKDYVEQNAMMKSSSGHYTTQFSMKDSDYQGALKLDALTVQNIDRIRTAMDLLVEYGYLEDKENLRDNYNAHIHPDNLVYDDKEMWNKIANSEVPDLFQFDSPVGAQCVRKVRPQTVEELGFANDIMRLMSDGTEQPIDKYVRHRDNPQDWYKEMQDYNLDDKDIKILERHLKDVHGVSVTQEELMLLLMDEDICNFSILDANFARKVVGKKIVEDIPKVREMMFSQGKGSDNLKTYVWDTQISPQMQYSFSKLHSTGYSLIALQNANIAHRFPRVFWDAACLNVSAGADEDNENNKGTDYGRIGKAIGNMQAQGVKVVSPYINKAGFGFAPDVDIGGIIFSLKAITSMNDETARNIIEHRPYKSFEDFHERMYLTKLVNRSQLIMLIKAGSFNEFDTPVNIMKDFLVKETPVKDTLNGRNLPKIIDLGLLDNPKLKRFKVYYNIRKYLRDNVEKKLPEEKNRWLKLHNDYSEKFFMVGFTKDCVVSFNNGNLIIDEKTFEKEYKELMLPLNKLYKDKEFIRDFNNAQFKELWMQHASGTVEGWEMESVNFYSDKHEIEYMDKEYYNLADFSRLSEEPVVLKENTSKNGRVYKEFKLFRIAGTVLDKNKNSHTITLLTETGVVTVKMYGAQFAKYDRQIKRDGKVIEKPWTSRGNILMISGYRRENQFVVRAPYRQEPVSLIHKINGDGSATLQTERDL